MLPILFRKNIINTLDNFGKEFDGLSNKLDDIFHFHGVSPFRDIPSPLFSPSLDLIEKEKNYLIDIEIPGMDQKDIDVTINEDDNSLVIKGNKEYKKEEENEDIHINERFYGSFRREMNLPSNCNLEKVEAEYKNGVLTLNLPKKEEKTTKHKKIEVK